MTTMGVSEAAAMFVGWVDRVIFRIIRKMAAKFVTAAVVCWQHSGIMLKMAAMVAGEAAISWQYFMNRQ